MRRRKIRRAPQNTSCAACCMRALRLSLGHKTVCSLIHTLQGHLLAHLLAHIKFPRDLLAHLLAHHQPKLIPTGLARTDELDDSRAAKDVELTLCSRLAASKRFSNRSCSKSFATSEQFQNPIAATLSFVLYGLCFGLAAVFNADPLVQSIPRTSASYHIVLIANQSQLRRQDFADTGSEVTDRSRDTILADYSHKAPSSRTQKCTMFWLGAVQRRKEQRKPSIASINQHWKTQSGSAGTCCRSSSATFTVRRFQNLHGSFLGCVGLAKLEEVDF